MTPEQLEGIRQDVSAHYATAVMVDGGIRFDLLDPKYITQADLLDYIDVLHEDLRLTREERDAEKHKCLVRRKDTARLADANDALTGYVRRLERERAMCWENHRTNPTDSEGPQE